MSDNKEKIGVFGGTFNPIHYGHLRAAEEVREKLGFGRILFVPSCNPPLKSGDLAPAGHRYEMTRLAIEGNPFFEISDIECSRPGKSYTVETLEALGGIYSGKELYLIAGIDSFLDIPAWYRPERLMEITNFVVISRPGFRFSQLSRSVRAEAEVLAMLDESRLEVYTAALPSGREAILLNVTPFSISSTALRGLSRRGKSLKYLLPDTIESFIISHNLYQEGSDDL